MNNLNYGTEQFGDFSKNVVDAAAKFAQVSFDSAERMFALNIEAAKVGFDEVAKSTKAATAVKDVQEFNGLRTKAAETGLEFMVGYAKNFYEISNAAQASYSSLVEERVSAFQKQVVEGIDKAAKNAPAGTDVAFAALKSGVAASTAAFDTFNKAGKQVANFADNAFKAATEQTASVAKAGAKRK
ncbi:MAG TPA: phasin family protein [Usitatibacteraceae bacterium]|nr:phasin family protein [Usitatibacteraceae bacterium]